MIKLHIPDGFLSTPIWVSMWVIALLIIGYAVRRTNEKLGERHVPMMGVLAAFIFAVQMLNMPVAGGTSGHMLGGVLSAIFLGPFAATIVMSTVFAVQAIFFQDGGITALGANIINMGLIGTILGYYIYQGIRKVVGGEKGILIGAGVAGWTSLMLGAISCALMLGTSGVAPLGVALPAMAGIHMFIGVIEAGLTVVIVGMVLKSRPDLMELQKI
ncbi:MAG: energy-coupling factor ABC transporter permease [Methanocellales archaeon]|nr:energy-coupling factor ABC transporter permease [Methanocellales archaeon]MDD5447272.1 energy-coupling factor ABC transporter permease [Methanocellales archaeon]